MIIGSLVTANFLFTLMTPAIASEPIVVGVPNARAIAEGDCLEKGMTLALEEINGMGGVSVGGVKRPFQLEIMDTRDCEPGVPVSEALLVVERLVLNKKAKFIVGGPIRTEAYHAAMDLFNKHKIISISHSGAYSPATAKRIAESYDKYRYCFRLTGHVGVELMVELPVILKELKETLGFSKAYIMVADVEHCRKSGEIAEAQLPKWGYSVLGHKIYPGGTTDFSLGLIEAKNKGADILWIWNDFPDVGVLMRQWADFKMKALPMGYARPSQDPDFWKMTDGKCAYAVLTALNAGNVPNKLNPWAERYNENWKKKWGKEPAGYASSAAYMSLYVLKDAIERADSLDTEAVLAALEKTDIKEGVYGRVRFDPKSHDIIRGLDPAEGALGCWFQWQEGKRVHIFPKSGATGTLQMPSWLKR
jgi:branched-chain amino acid transport system substrate-binding protein